MGGVSEHIWGYAGGVFLSHFRGGCHSLSCGWKGKSIGSFSKVLCVAGLRGLGGGTRNFLFAWKGSIFESLFLLWLERASRTELRKTTLCGWKGQFSVSESLCGWKGKISGL